MTCPSIVRRWRQKSKIQKTDIFKKTNKLLTNQENVFVWRGPLTLPSVFQAQQTKLFCLRFYFGAEMMQHHVFMSDMQLNVPLLRLGLFLN